MYDCGLLRSGTDMVRYPDNSDSCRLESRARHMKVKSTFLGSADAEAESVETENGQPEALCNCRSRNDLGVASARGLLADFEEVFEAFVGYKRFVGYPPCWAIRVDDAEAYSTPNQLASVCV